MLHFNIARQWNSIVPGTQAVLRTAKKVMRRMLPGSPRSSQQANAADFKENLQKHEKVTIFNFFVQK